MAAAPTWLAAAANSGVANVTAVLPAHNTGDLLLIFTESTGGQNTSVSNTELGWAEAANSGGTSNTGLNGTKVQVFWKLATSNNETAPLFLDAGNHTFVNAVRIRGVNQSSPIGATATGSKAPASNSFSVSGVTTTVANAMVIYAITRDNDSSSTSFSNNAGTNLATVTEGIDAGTTQGNGGGLGVYYGILTANGASGTLTGNVASSENAFWVGEIKPTVDPQTYSESVTFSANSAFSDAGGLLVDSNTTLSATSNLADTAGLLITVSTSLNAVGTLADASSANLVATYTLAAAAALTGNSTLNAIATSTLASTARANTASTLNAIATSTFASTAAANALGALTVSQIVTLTAASAFTPSALATMLSTVLLNGTASTETGTLAVLAAALSLAATGSDTYDYIWTGGGGGGTTYQEALSLVAASALSPDALAEFLASTALDTQVNWSAETIATLNSALALAGQTVLALSAGAVYNKSTSLDAIANGQSFSTAASVLMNAVATLTSNASLSDSALHTLAATLALGAYADLTRVSIHTATCLTALGADAEIASSAGLNLLSSLALSAATTLRLQSFLTQVNGPTLARILSQRLNVPELTNEEWRQLSRLVSEQLLMLSGVSGEQLQKTSTLRNERADLLSSLINDSLKK